MLSKFFYYLRRRIKSDGFNSFVHFFATFTGIFLVLTVLILQVMHYGVFSSVDSSLRSAASDADSYLRMEMVKTNLVSTFGNSKTDDDTTQGSSSDTQNSGDKTKDVRKKKEEEPPAGISVAANTSVLVLDSDGNILNTIDSYSSLGNLVVDKNNLNVVMKASAKNYFNQIEKYRMITVPVQDSLYPEVAYVIIAINTTQLEDANQRYIRIIVIMMATFWAISMGASMYLAKWSRRPIQESLEKQKSFVENASHELRTPLAVIQNRLEALFRKPESTILENTENIASSLDEVRNMRLLTINLLNLARRDDGITVNKETIQSSYFDDMFANYQMIAEENSKQLIIDNQVTRDIYSDKVLLKQLVTILFDNALKYTDEDGQVSITVRTNDRHLYIKIADNGPGIANSDKKKIFDRFYRVDKARTRQKGGFGLGLSLAKQIILALKGTIAVKDNQPKGTVFEVKLTNV